MLRVFGVSLQNCKLFRLFVGFALPPWPPCATSATEAFAVYGPRRATYHGLVATRTQGRVST
jgi:hypothetical protein